MSVRQRSNRRIDWERQLERLCPTKHKLIRALPLTCPNALPDRNSHSLACAICNGTGYNGAPRGADIYSPPYSQFFFMYGDIQSGHGLLGAGGDLIRIIPDLGKFEVGDAVLYCKVQEIDRATGKAFTPSVDPALPRPDRIIDKYGTIYNVTQSLLGNFGDEDVFRLFVLKQGSFH